MTRSVTARLVFGALLWAPAECEPQAGQQMPAQPEIKAAPETPIAVKKEELGQPAWNPGWDKVMEEAPPPEMLSPRVAKDVKPFCPRFNSLGDGDKRAFWAYFFQALSGAEAGLTPTANTRHTEPEVAVKDTVSRRMVRSEGLLQLTYMDTQRYGCDFDWDNDKQLEEKDPAKTILQPKNNLLCGVKILTKQLIDQKEPLLTRSSYWSTLRPRKPGYSVFIKQMANVPSVCRLPKSLNQAPTDRAAAAPVSEPLPKPSADHK